ncbi:MAG TPA: MBL fold metallo-hydrolase RNA specificity domain-containing protein [Verrucomicrobiae bacterium]|nr:MBL fold metallo-hydrolase RNA specificity domain-containing protein [Verrucomicrobiae bacterium]
MTHAQPPGRQGRHENGITPISRICADWRNSCQRCSLKNNIGDQRNLARFIGYCAEGTLGDQITKGKSPVNIFGDPCDVRAGVVSLDTYSGHADKNELKRYVERISGNLKKIICIHGEESQCLAPVETLRRMKPEAEVLVPEYRQVVEI